MDELKHRILIIDPDSEHICALSRLLQDNGYLTQAVSARHDAVAAVQNWQPDLVILDILTPLFNALDLLEDLRKNPATEHQKVLILTQPSNIEMISGPTPSVAGYLTKPVDFEELKKILADCAGEASAGNRIPVLVADDDYDFRDILRMFLETNYYMPLMASSGAKALEKARSERPAAILLDLMMPDKDGFQVLDELRNECSTSDIPVIILSAVRLNTYQDRGLLTGEPEIISKQVPAEFLLQTIENRLKGTVGLAETSSLPVSKPKVILADDQPELLSLMKEMLEKSGFDVFAAADGREALDLIRRENPDIAVLDY
ncbi:MAG: response regulator, partial [bacterium]